MLDDADKDCPPLICTTRIACTATTTEPVTSEAGDAVRLTSATVAKVSGGSFQTAKIDPYRTLFLSEAAVQCHGSTRISYGQNSSRKRPSTAPRASPA